MFKNEYREGLDQKILSYNKVLELQELDSWELDISWYKIITFVLNNDLSTDYIEMYVKITLDWEWIKVGLCEWWTYIRIKDTYEYDITWVKKIKFIRTWVADWDIRLDVSLTVTTN